VTGSGARNARRAGLAGAAIGLAAAGGKRHETARQREAIAELRVGGDLKEQQRNVHSTNSKLTMNA